MLRRADPNDRRANLIYLSDKAKGLLEPIYENGAAVMNDLMAGLNTAEQKQLVSLLLPIKTNAQHLSQNSATNGSAK